MKFLLKKIASVRVHTKRVIEGHRRFSTLRDFFSVPRRSLFTNIEKTIHTEMQGQLKLSWPLLGARTLELGRDFSEGSKRG